MLAEYSALFGKRERFEHYASAARSYAAAHEAMLSYSQVANLEEALDRGQAALT